MARSRGNINIYPYFRDVFRTPCLRVPCAVALVILLVLQPALMVFDNLVRAGWFSAPMFRPVVDAVRGLEFTHRLLLRASWFVPFLMAFAVIWSRIIRAARVGPSACGSCRYDRSASPPDRCTECGDTTPIRENQRRWRTVFRYNRWWLRCVVRLPRAYTLEE